MKWLLHRLVLAVAVAISMLALPDERHSRVRALRQISCRDPDVGGTIEANSDRRFVIFGAHEPESAGIGNLFIFWPAVYYYAALTGRDIIISDGSTFGEVCRLIHCGFPFQNDLLHAFPEILTVDNVKNAACVKAIDMKNWIEGTDPLPNQAATGPLPPTVTASVVRGCGFMPNSDWWVYFNTSAECVGRITGCRTGDVGCAERHAFQRLIRGPFRASKLTDAEEKRVHGIPDHMKHAILTLPHSYAPRLDAAIHLRAQFNHFEKNTAIDDPEYKLEVKNWLNSSEAATVFDQMTHKLLETLNEFKKPPPGHLNLKDGNHSKPIDAFIYLAGDNEEVKDSFVSYLNNRSHEKFKINIMRVDAASIHHVKNLAKLKEATNNEGLMDLVFDWYALSLANVILAWRKGSTHLISTFVHSAQRVSGNREKTNPTGIPGHGVGTRGLQLMKNRRGSPQWNFMWSYGFLDEYNQP